MLPNGRLMNQEHRYTSAEIITERLQVVVSLSSWLKPEETAGVMIELVNDLLAYTSSQQSACPVRCFWTRRSTGCPKKVCPTWTKRPSVNS